tara:strand:+ start:1916 stop:2293 length:378 start_codon:yes stop_codon:yes gene_type:complete
LFVFTRIFTVSGNREADLEATDDSVRTGETGLTIAVGLTFGEAFVSVLQVLACADTEVTRTTTLVISRTLHTEAFLALTFAVVCARITADQLSSRINTVLIFPADDRLFTLVCGCVALGAGILAV